MVQYSRKSFSHFYSILVKLESILLKSLLYRYCLYLLSGGDGLKVLLDGLKMGMVDYVSTFN
jgi:hypothetical protein